MTIAVVRTHWGHEAYVREPDGKRRLIHVTDPADTREAALAAARAWCATASPLMGGRFGWADDATLAEAS